MELLAAKGARRLCSRDTGCILAALAQVQPRDVISDDELLRTQTGRDRCALLACRRWDRGPCCVLRSPGINVTLPQNGPNQPPPPHSESLHTVPGSQELLLNSDRHTLHAPILHPSGLSPVPAGARPSPA